MNDICSITDLIDFCKRNKVEVTFRCADYENGIIFTLRKGDFKNNCILDEECDYIYQASSMLNQLNKYEEDHKTNA